MRPRPNRLPGDGTAPSRQLPRLARAAGGGLLAATILVSGETLAQAPPDLSQWRCALCPFEHGADAEYTAGASYASDGAARFADGNGYDRQGGYLLADGEGRYADERQRLVWRVEDLGLDARALGLEGNRGAIDYRLSYRELPHYLFDTTATVFRTGANGALSLPGGWVRAPVTSQMSSLDSSLLPRSIDSQRNVLDLGVTLHPREPLEVYTDYRHQERSGTTIAGGSFFNTTSQLPVPIDQSTDDFTVGVRRSSPHGTLDLGYRGSYFDNRLPVITWENPFTSPPGAERGALAGAPDNSFQSLSLGGAFHFLKHTALAFSAGAGRGEQNEALLPYTVNPQLTTSPLPRSTLDGVVETSHVALTVSTRPWSRLHVRGAYRYDQRDNRTPVSMWNRVITDTFNTVASDNNVAYDFERARLNLSADADLSRQLRLSAGYDRTERNRNSQEVAGQTENGGWGRLRWRFAPGFEVNVRRGTARRDIDRYDTALATELKQNPLLAKYDLAYRFRTYADAAFTASGTKRPFTFALSALYADDDYTRSRLGLARDRDRRVAADVGWTFTPHVSLFASVSDEKIDALQNGSESFAAPDWSAAHTDRFRTLAGGLRFVEIPPRFDLTVDFSRADGATAVALASTAGNGAFPDLASKLDALRIRALYHRSARMSVLLQLRYEHLHTDDWALANVAPATIPGLLALGADPYRYNVVVVGAGVTYRWGAGNR
jgi:MtrB/PioB family decaheme-associated outer membrane protein